MEFRKMVTMTLFVRQQKRTDFWTLWEKARVGRYDRIALNMYITICKIDDQSKFDA